MWTVISGNYNFFLLCKDNIRQYTYIRMSESENTKRFHFIISAKPLNVRINKVPLKNYQLIWEIKLTYMMWWFCSCVYWYFICWTIRYHLATSGDFILRRRSCKTCKVVLIRGEGGHRKKAFHPRMHGGLCVLKIKLQHISIPSLIIKE